MAIPNLRSPILVVFVVISSHLILNAAADYSTLIYKGCARQTFYADSGFQEALSVLFESLVVQSQTKRFFKTSSTAGQRTISGLFQCRGDLPAPDCHSCVQSLPEMAISLCKQSVAGRVHVLGCYIVYQTAEFAQISGTDMLYKTCSSSEKHDVLIQENKDAVLNQLVTGVSFGNAGAGGGVFYATTRSPWYAIAQCEGDLGLSDCGLCIREAVQRARAECGTSIAGQVYLNRCFISYSYYRHSSGQQTGKTVAIVVGGVAAVGLAVTCLLCIRSVLKKHDDD